MSSAKIIRTAKDLGLKITRAEQTSEMFQCWADRVQQCWVYLRDREIAAYYAMRNEADRYAI